MANSRSWQERRLGHTVLRTYRDTVDLDDIMPGNRLRVGLREDPEFQRQIEANEGIFEPLLLEPHPDSPGKFRIIDGDRRWINSKVLVTVQQKQQYRRLPAEITDRTLTEDERLRVWIHIQRQRKEWDAREKEPVASRLVDLMGRASAANILGITVRELDKLVQIYELSQKLHLQEPGASITWAREVRGISKNLLNEAVLNTIIRKINEREITNSKDVRKLRTILRDPTAKEELLSEQGTIRSALEIIAPSNRKGGKGLAADLATLVESIGHYPWTTLTPLKGDQNVIDTIEKAEKLLKQLKKNLSQ